MLSKSLKEFMKIEEFRDPELETCWCTDRDVQLQSAVRCHADNARASEKCC